MSSSIPPRLSDRQKFVLAVLADTPTTIPEGFRSDRLSRVVADAFGDSDASSRQPMSDTHYSSHSRTMSRLEDRELVKRSSTADPLGLIWNGGDTNGTYTWPTEEGRETGGEIRRQHSDGRYAFELPAEPWTDDDWIGVERPDLL